MKKLSLFLLGLFIYSSVWSGSDYNIQVVKTENSRLHFRFLNAWNDDGKVQVTGKISSASMIGNLGGHIDVAVYGRSGQLIEETTADYFPKVISHKNRRRGGARFTAELSKDIPNDAVIKVAFHREVYKPRPKPSHMATVAK